MEAKRANGEVVTESRIRWIGAAAVDVVFFSVLFLLFLFLFAMPIVPLQKVIHTEVCFLMLNEVMMLAGALLAAYIVFRSRELPFRGLGLTLKGWWRSLWTGALFIACLYAAGFGLSLWLGAVEVAAVCLSPVSLLLSLLFFFLVAVTEEVMVRGFILGRMLDGGVNKFAALSVSAVLFSLMHLFNPNFAFVPFLNIVLAGFFLGASYIYTRNLCLPIVLHWFWNWIQGPVLGYKVSGNEFNEGGLLVLRLPEENLINGGGFGFEGSVLCSLLLVVGTVLIIAYYERHRALL